MTGAGHGSHRNPAELVSVVIGTKDRRDLLHRTLSSVLTQSHVDLDVVVVDDGSSDGTTEYLRQHPDPRVRHVRHDHARGVAHARNTGLAAARGSLVAFTDDDDLWAPHKVGAQVAAMSSRPGAVWSFVTAVVVDTRLRPVGWQPAPPPEGLERRLLAVNDVPGGASGVVADIRVVRSVGAFDTRFAHFADWDLWIRLAAAGPAAPVHEPLLAYLRHDGMSTASAHKFEDLSLMTAKYAQRRERLGAESNVPHVLRWIGEMALRAGDRATALQAYEDAMRLSASRRAQARWVAARAPGFLRARDLVQWGQIPLRGRRQAARWLEPIRAVGTPAVTAS
jgi:glycosyltransferase involved in cell wall biosynthesis